MRCRINIILMYQDIILHMQDRRLILSLGSESTACLNTAEKLWTPTALHRQKLCYEILHLLGLIIIQKSSPTEDVAPFPTPLKSFNIHFLHLSSPISKIMFLLKKSFNAGSTGRVILSLRQIWGRKVLSSVEQMKFKLSGKKLDDRILCYDRQVIHNHKGEKHLHYKCYHQLLPLL